MDHGGLSCASELTSRPRARPQNADQLSERAAAELTEACFDLFPVVVEEPHAAAMGRAPCSAMGRAPYSAMVTKSRAESVATQPGARGILGDARRIGRLFAKHVSHGRAGVHSRSTTTYSQGCGQSIRGRRWAPIVWSHDDA